MVQPSAAPFPKALNFNLNVQSVAVIPVFGLSKNRVALNPLMNQHFPPFSHMFPIEWL